MHTSLVINWCSRSESVIKHVRKICNKHYLSVVTITIIVSSEDGLDRTIGSGRQQTRRRHRRGCSLNVRKKAVELKMVQIEADNKKTNVVRGCSWVWDQRSTPNSAKRHKYTYLSSCGGGSSLVGDAHVGEAVENA